MVEPLSEYWAIPDIARYLGIKRSTLTAYVARGQFPEPDATIGTTKVWRKRMVTEWAASRPRRPIEPE